MESMNEIELVPCVSNMVEEIWILIFLFEPKDDTCSLGCWTLASSSGEDTLGEDSSEVSGLDSMRMSRLLRTSRRWNFYLLTLPNWVLLHTVRAFLVFRSLWARQVAASTWEMEYQALATMSRSSCFSNHMLSKWNLGTQCCEEVWSEMVHGRKSVRESFARGEGKSVIPRFRYKALVKLCKGESVSPIWPS